MMRRLLQFFKVSGYRFQVTEFNLKPETKKNIFNEKPPLNQQ